MRKVFHRIIIITGILMTVPSVSASAQLAEVIEALMKVAGLDIQTVGANPAWWAQILDQVRTGQETADGVVNLGEQMEQQGSLFNKLYTGVSYFKQTKKMETFLAECSNMHRTYENYINFFKNHAADGVSSFNELTQMVVQGTYFMEQALKDMEAVTALMGLQMSNGERDTKMDEAIARMREGQRKLQAAIDGWVEDLQEKMAWSVLQGLTGGRKKKVTGPGIDTDPLLNQITNTTSDEIRKLASMTQEEWNERMMREFDRASDIDNDSIDQAARNISAAKKPAIRFAELVILLLSALYVPYNLWRSRTGERQSTDAMMRIFIGLMVGFTALIFLEAILKL